MSHVTAVISGRDDEPVRVWANALADLMQVDAQRMVLPDHDHDRQVELVVRSLAHADVAAGVISVDAPEGLCWDVLPRVEVPMLVVPRHPSTANTQISRVLVPLDGRAETSACVCDLAEQLASGGAEIVAVHVFAPETVPAFWDQPAHSHVSWRSEFLRRHLPGAQDLGLRRGDPATEVLAEVAASGVDLLLLGWAQDLGAGRATLVREALMRSPVPVLLVRMPS